MAAIEAEAARWFLWAPVMLAAGIGAYFALPVEPPVFVFALALAGVVACGRAGRAGRAVPVSLMLAVALGGFVLAKARMEAARAPAIDRRMGPVWVQGVAEDADPARGSQVRVVVRVASVEGLAPGDVPRRLVIVMPDAEGLKPGAGVRVRAVLVPLLTPVTPGGHDPALAQWFAGVGGNGFAREAPEIVRGSGSGFHEWISGVRLAMSARIRAVLGGDAGAFADAVITGERSRLSADATRDMQVSGLAHIISISGLHLSLVAGGVFWCVRAGLALFPRLALRRPIKKYAAVAGLCAGLFYTLLSGAQVAALRAFIMIAVMFAAVLMDRPALSIRNVALAASAILIFLPEAVLGASFQMSFLAVTGLVALHEAVSAWRRGRADFEESWRKRAGLKLALMLGVSLVAGLFSGIPAAYHFHRISPYSLLANVIAAPFVSFLVMPMALAGAVLMPLGLEGWPLKAMGFGLEWVLAIARWVARLPGAAGMVPQQTAFGAIVIATGALWLCLWQGRVRLLGVGVMVAGVFVSSFHRAPDVLVERGARNVAVRMEDGRLAFADARRGRYAAEKWLAASGDDARLGKAAKRGAWACSADACVAEVRGRRVVFLRGREAAGKPDCRAGDVVVAEFPLRGLCRDAAVRIDRFSVWREGAQAVFVEDEGLRVETAQGERGMRPWVTRVKAGVRMEGRR